MPARINFATVFLACLVCFLSSQNGFAKKMYRWIDEQGNTFFSDQVPPEHSQYRRDSLSKTGRVLEVTEKAKTKEQLELEKRLAKLRSDQEKIIANQKIHDKALLSTFHSKEDLLATIKVKLQALDTQKKVMESNLDRLINQLEEQQKKAANLERNAQKVPEKLLANIQSTQDQIQEARNAISIRIDKQNLIKEEYNADIERFLFLTQSRTEPQPQAKIASIKEANKLGLFYCENDRQCNKAWEIARIFVNANSTTMPDIYNDKLIMNRPPAKDTDLSLSLSKIAVDENDYQLFLDIRCRDSSQGNELCASQKVIDIRSAFRPYINDALSRAAQQ
ncbi:MAG: DUF4124 domain-containing protein [Methylobacter sp.]|nr:DUF4124 domain-containing protein [Methylobacter sp.]